MKKSFVFGCEFEFSSKWDDMEQWLRQIIKNNNQKILIPKLESNRYYSSSNNKRWHLKTDSSTETELCTPVSTLRNLPTICKVVGSLTNAKITNKDSVHVHFECSDVNIVNLLSAWLLIESTIIQCFPIKRSKTSYASRLAKGRKGKILINYLKSARIESDEHHAMLSFYHYEKRKTVELRLSNGTNSPEDIRNLVYFCYYFKEFSKNIDVFEAMAARERKRPIQWLIKIMQIEDEFLEKWLKTRYNIYKR